ncbi:MAG: hypothetical protein ABFE07_28225 [Armatimonadia bacterium]
MTTAAGTAFAPLLEARLAQALQAAGFASRPVKSAVLQAVLDDPWYVMERTLSEQLTIVEGELHIEINSDATVTVRRLSASGAKCKEG